MKIEFTGRQTEVPAEIRHLAERKLKKLTRVLPGITWAHVIVSSDRYRQIAEVSIRSKRLDLTAREESTDLGGSLLAVMDRLTRQVTRRLGRLRERKRAARGGGEPKRGANGRVRSARPRKKPKSPRRAAVRGREPVAPMLRLGRFELVEPEA
jgi:putative sigma-54 modulation protein